MTDNRRDESELNAVVTGSSTGIGRAIAVELSRAGFRVAVHGRQASPELDQTAALVAENSDCHPFTFDLAGGESLSAFVDQVESQIGRIDVWVNNAGADILTGELADADFNSKLQRLWEVDTRATLLLSRLVAERMIAAGKKQTVDPSTYKDSDLSGDQSAFKSTDDSEDRCGSVWGSIINVGWDQAWTGMAGESGQLYSATKGAIMAMTASLAKSYAPRVRVNCVAPGWIRTAWGETASAVWQDRARSESLLQRWGTPEDVASVVAFLADRQSEFVNGQTIYVNGGLVARSE